MSVKLPGAVGVVAAACLAACITLCPVQAQPAQKPARPLVGQPGKDAIWVPTPGALIEMMLDLAKVTASDRVVDLGSGDGRAVIAAAKRGALARGIEYDANLVAISKASAEKEGVGGRAVFERADMFATDFSDATVVVLFLLPDLNIKLRPSILNMKPGTRVVSNTFEMGGWLPDEVKSLREECDFFFCRALLWIVPAKVDGEWTITADGVAGRMSLKQQFQTFAGSITSGVAVTPVSDGRLAADELTFVADGVAYSGRVRGDIIEGTTKSGAPWQARRGN
ncbi:SAM-dependent methyltransferase [Pseudorhodoplanes sp.]|uniref:SAM-dependent methyltransferase n=1 Tax=Pseudorhodoplanes sp. TaxID=1934341 RepID=UPI003D0F425F